MALLFFIMCVKLSDVVCCFFFPKPWTFLSHANKKYYFFKEMLEELPLSALKDSVM